MQSPLIPDIKHPKWIVANKILETIDSNRSRKIASKLNIYDVSYFIAVMKIIVLSNLFERDISNVISEINHYQDLSKILKLKYHVESQDIYKYLSNANYEAIFSFFNRLFQLSKKNRSIRQKTVIIDSTYIDLDLNLRKNRSKIGNMGKKYKYSFYPSIGYYVGFKLILAIDQNFDIIGFQIHENCPNDSKLLFTFVESLFKSRRLKYGDIILCDKGFTSKKNYILLINRFCLIPLIYPRKNTKIDQIIRSLCPPLETFFDQKYKLQKWKSAVKEFKEKMANWEQFKITRSKIEDLFNISKNCLQMNQLHQYTHLSVSKSVAIKLFLTEKLICLCAEENIEIKALPSW
jgi:hypothetical protein